MPLVTQPRELRPHRASPDEMTMLERIERAIAPPEALGARGPRAQALHHRS
jgi:hypothetical protein